MFLKLCVLASCTFFFPKTLCPGFGRRCPLQKVCCKNRHAGRRAALRNLAKILQNLSIFVPPVLQNLSSQPPQRPMNTVFRTDRFTTFKISNSSKKTFAPHHKKPPENRQRRIIKTVRMTRKQCAEKFENIADVFKNFLNIGRPDSLI